MSVSEMAVDELERGNPVTINCWTIKPKHVFGTVIYQIDKHGKFFGCLHNAKTAVSAVKYLEENK